MQQLASVIVDVQFISTIRILPMVYGLHATLKHFKNVACGSIETPVEVCEREGGRALFHIAVESASQELSGC